MKKTLAFIMALVLTSASYPLAAAYAKDKPTEKTAAETNEPAADAEVTATESTTTTTEALTVESTTTTTEAAISESTTEAATAESTTTTTEVTTTVKADILYGDANSDGEVKMSDAVLIMQSLANPNKFSLSAEQRKAADVCGNSDGITNKDALGVQRYLLKLVDALPVREHTSDAVITAPDTLPDGYIISDAEVYNTEDGDFANLSLVKNLYAPVIAGLNDTEKKSYYLRNEIEIYSDLMFVNGNYRGNTSGNKFVIRNNNYKAIILGDYTDFNRLQIVTAYDASELGDNFSVKDVPLIYIDGTAYLNSPDSFNLNKESAGKPLNLIIGSVAEPNQTFDEFVGDVYLMDEGADNFIGKAGISRIKKWETGVENIGTMTSTGGNLFCNGNLTLSATEIDGDLRVRGNLVIKDNVKVHGDIYCGGTLTVSDVGNFETDGTVNTDLSADGSANNGIYPLCMTRESIYGTQTENGFVPAPDETKLIYNAADIRKMNGFNTDGSRKTSVYPDVQEVMKKLENKEKIVFSASTKEQVIEYDLDGSKYLYFDGSSIGYCNQEIHITGTGDNYIVFDKFSSSDKMKIILDDENCNYHIIMLGKNELRDKFDLISKRIYESKKVSYDMPLNIYMYSDEDASLSITNVGTITAHALTPDMTLRALVEGSEEIEYTSETGEIIVFSPTWIGSCIFRQTQTINDTAFAYVGIARNNAEKSE